MKNKPKVTDLTKNKKEKCIHGGLFLSCPVCEIIEQRNKYERFAKELLSKLTIEFNNNHKACISDLDNCDIWPTIKQVKEFLKMKEFLDEK